MLKSILFLKVQQSAKSAIQTCNVSRKGKYTPSLTSPIYVVKLYCLIHDMYKIHLVSLRCHILYFKPILDLHDDIFDISPAAEFASHFANYYTINTVYLMHNARQSPQI
jgi:hypothetical protein